MKNSIYYFVAMLLAIGSVPTFASSSIQLFTGRADTARSDVNVNLLYIVPPVSGTETVDGNSSTVGFRYITTPVPSISLGLEISQFDAISNTVEMNFVPISALLFYTHKEYAVEPYVGIGLSIAYVSLKISGSSSLGTAVSENTFSTGRELRAGVSYPFSEQYSLFLEYRRSKFEIDIETESLPFFSPSTVTSRITSDVDTSHILLGFSYNF